MSILANRSVHLDDIIDESLANYAIARILQMDAENDEEPIILFINSQGGSVTAGFAVYDAIKFVKSPVWTVGVEVATGIGLLLLVAGSKGSRFLLPDAFVSLTHVTYDLNATVALSVMATQEAARVRNLIIGAFASDTGRPMGEISGEMTAERSFGSDAAVQYGFADKIISFHSLLKLITCEE